MTYFSGGMPHSPDRTWPLSDDLKMRIEHPLENLRSAYDLKMFMLLLMLMFSSELMEIEEVPVSGRQNIACCYA